MGDGPNRQKGGSVWQELYGFVYGYLRHHGLSHSDAEDLTQDVLETAVVNLDAVKPGKLRAWLVAVARNKLVDRARRASRSTSVAELPDTADPARDPAEQAIASADREALRAAMALLSERDRRLIELRYLEERTVADTAKQAGLSVTATKVALLRARERLRNALEHSGGTDERD